MNLDEINSDLLKGDEVFRNGPSLLEESISDFWSWNSSNLLDNTTRGKLAEYIVGIALGCNMSKPRVDWDDYDLITINGVKVEVKSAAYIQSWRQRFYSKISFTIASRRQYNSASMSRNKTPHRPADIYVFALLKHQNQSTIDPMDMSQWVFYVVLTKEINKTHGLQKSISINPLKRLSPGYQFHELKEVVSQLTQ